MKRLSNEEGGRASQRELKRRVVGDDDDAEESEGTEELRDPRTPSCGVLSPCAHTVEGGAHVVVQSGVKDGEIVRDEEASLEVGSLGPRGTLLDPKKEASIADSVAQGGRAAQEQTAEPSQTNLTAGVKEGATGKAQAGSPPGGTALVPLREARHMVLSDKDVMSVIVGALVTPNDLEAYKTAAALLRVCRAWRQVSLLWAAVAGTVPKVHEKRLGCENFKSWSLLAGAPVEAARAAFDNLIKKRKALILPALHAELADVHPRSWKNTFRRTLHTDFEWTQLDAMAISAQVHNLVPPKIRRENRSPFVSVVWQLPFEPHVPAAIGPASSPRFHPVAYAEVEVMLLSTRQWGTRLSVGLVHTTKAYQLCTTSTWLGAEGSGSVAIGYIVDTQYDLPEHNRLIRLPSGEPLGTELAPEERFRARDVIGIGIDISSLSVFWTRNGLYKGVLADTATLLDVVRQALGEGGITVEYLRRLLPTCFSPAVTSRGPLKLRWRLGHDGFCFDVNAYIFPPEVPEIGHAARAGGK